MQIREIKPINFLFYRAETRLNELGSLVPKAKELFKEAVRLDLHVTGPVHWHNFGFTGDESNVFTLEISLPLSQIPPDYDGQLHFKRTQPFKSVAIIHEGTWMNMLTSYTKLMEFIQKNNLQTSGMNREIYMNVDFADPEANVTEIQVGLL